MSIKMPRGAIPPARNELVVSEQYRPQSGPEVFLPSGDFPSPNHELVAATHYKGEDAPASFLAWPIGLSFWGNDTRSNSLWAEEAFAKACVEPKIYIPVDIVFDAQKRCSANFAEFMQKEGFRVADKAYLDGQFQCVDWTNASTLNSAIAKAGPVKLGVASHSLLRAVHGTVTPGTNGWAIHGLSSGYPENHCVSLCGYGTLDVLVDLFGQLGTVVNLPQEMPTELCYAMFTWGSIGIIDARSLISITGEAWVRTPTTIVQNLAA